MCCMIDGRNIVCSKQRVTNQRKQQQATRTNQKQGRVCNCKAGKESKWGQIKGEVLARTVLLPLKVTWTQEQPTSMPAPSGVMTIWTPSLVLSIFLLFR